MGDGLGSFSSNVVSVGSEITAVSLAICDFNGDGFQDIAIGELFSYVTILFGDGAGGFIVSSYFSLPKRPDQLAIADLNGDGKQDFVTLSTTGRSMSIRFNSNEITNTWLGLTSEWNKPTNWSLGMIPSACAKLIVNTGVPFLPTITGINNTCYSLTLNNGANINMASGAILNITGE